MTPEDRREAAWSRVRTAMLEAIEETCPTPKPAPAPACGEPVTLDGLMLHCHRTGHPHPGDHVATTPTQEHRVTWQNTGRTWADRQHVAGECACDL